MNIEFLRHADRVRLYGVKLARIAVREFDTRT